MLGCSSDLHGASSVSARKASLYGGVASLRFERNPIRPAARPPSVCEPVVANGRDRLYVSSMGGSSRATHFSRFIVFEPMRCSTHSIPSSKGPTSMTKIESSTAALKVSPFAAPLDQRSMCTLRTLVDQSFLEVLASRRTPESWSTASPALWAQSACTRPLPIEQAKTVERSPGHASTAWPTREGSPGSPARRSSCQMIPPSGVAEATLASSQNALIPTLHLPRVSVAQLRLSERRGARRRVGERRVAT